MNNKKNKMISSQQFEDENVCDIYNKISGHFDKTRYHSWPKIEEFSKIFSKGSLIADVGCGNGRNCKLRNDCIFHGYDNCEGFVNICLKQGITCKKSNILNIDCCDNNYDYTMCIAVIHHLSTEERRIQAIKELIRITKPGGEILIYVWAKEQKKFKDHDTKDIFVPWNLQKRYSNQEETIKIYNRYYYLFEKGELEKLVYKADSNVKIKESGYQKDNYYVILHV